MNCVNSFILVFVAFMASMALSRPQTQLKWNWEEVILSRNGPSTTTTPRPTRWSTTTLRFLDIEPVKSVGSVGSVEDAYLVPRGQPRGQPLASAGSKFQGFAIFWLHFRNGLEQFSRHLFI